MTMWVSMLCAAATILLVIPTLFPKAGLVEDERTTNESQEA